MSHLPSHIEHVRANVSSIGYGQQLLEQSAAARDRGDHWGAQQLASAAHKWERDESVRLQNLGKAQEEWARMMRQIERAWDQDRSSATLNELNARNPKLTRVIASCEAVAERIRVLGGTVPPSAAPCDGEESPTPQ